jgi:hypothetical protein
MDAGIGELKWRVTTENGHDRSQFGQFVHFFLLLLVCIKVSVYQHRKDQTKKPLGDHFWSTNGFFPSS